MSLVISNLTRNFGRLRAVDNVSFAMAAGGVYGFVGPNGAGKTTTMRILATLDEPTAGDVFLDGVSIVDYPEAARRAVGFMPDSLPAHSDMTVWEYIDFFGRAYGLRGARLREARGAVARFAGLEPMRDKTLRSLSKGMRQRVSLARALVHDPRILVLDEPAAGLDPRARVELRELVAALAEQGKTLLISSHILSELAEICDHVVIIERGRLLHTGAIRDMLSNNEAPQRTLAVRPLGDLAPLQRTLLEMPNVRAVRQVAAELHVDLAGGDAEVAALLAEVVRRGPPLLAFYPVEDDLEDLFMKVTKGELA